MEEEQVEELRQLFQPMIDEMDGYLKSIIICGSAVRKERVEGSDIDVIVILDDHEEDFNSRRLQKAKLIAREVKKKGDKEGFDLHIQPPKPISHWYNLLLKGRPWAITSIRYSQPVYDPEGFQDTMKSVIEDSPPHSNESRARKLHREATKDIESAEKKLEQETLNQMIAAIYQAGRTLLEFKGETSVEPENLTEKIDEVTDTDLGGDLEFFDQLLEIRQGVRKNNDFDIKELDNYTEKAVELVEKLSQSFKEDLEKQNEKIIEQVYAEIEQTCREVLDDLGISYDEGFEVETFRKEVIEEDILSREYWDFIRRIRKMKEQNTLETRNTGEMLYRPMVNLKDFETAAQNVMENELYQSFQLREDRKKAQITPVNEFEEAILDRYGEGVKAVWLLTVENFLETSDANLVILHDMDNSGGLREKADELERKIGEEHGFNIHTRLEKLGDYWQKAQEGEKEIFYEIQNSIISYDPQGLVRSIKKLAKTGTGLLTPESVSEKLEETPREIVEPGEEARIDALEEYYRASIKLGQAVLLTENVSPPVQKKVPDVLEQNLPEESGIEKKDLETLRETITLYKQVEYGEIDEVGFEKLEEIGEKIKGFEQKTAKIISS